MEQAQDLYNTMIAKDAADGASTQQLHCDMLLLACDEMALLDSLPASTQAELQHLLPRFVAATGPHWPVLCMSATQLLLVACASL